MSDRCAILSVQFFLDESRFYAPCARSRISTLTHAKTSQSAMKSFRQITLIFQTRRSNGMTDRQSYLALNFEKSHLRRRHSRSSWLPNTREHVLQRPGAKGALPNWYRGKWSSCPRFLSSIIGTSREVAGRSDAARKPRLIAQFHSTELAGLQVLAGTSLSFYSKRFFFVNIDC